MPPQQRNSIEMSGRRAEAQSGCANVLLYAYDSDSPHHAPAGQSGPHHFRRSKLTPTGKTIPPSGLVSSFGRSGYLRRAVRHAVRNVDPRPTS